MSPTTGLEGLFGEKRFYKDFAPHGAMAAADDVEFVSERIGCLLFAAPSWVIIFWPSDALISL